MAPRLGPSKNAGQLNGIPVGITLPANNQSLFYNATSGMLEYADGAINVVYEYFPLMAGSSMIGDSATNLQQFETTTNHVRYIANTFADGGSEDAQWGVIFPDDWDGADANLGLVSARFAWTAGSGSGTVKFALKGILLPDDAAIDTAFGEVGDVTDTLITIGDMHYSSWMTPALIPSAGTGGKAAVFQVTRDSANDTLTSTARLAGIWIRYIRTFGGP